MKRYQFRVTFREDPTSYYAVRSTDVTHAIRQAMCAYRGLRNKPRQRLHVVKVENLDVVGWSEGYSAARFGDSTGIFHLIVMEAPHEVVCRAACHPNRRTYGSTAPTPPPHGHKCATCAKIAKRITWKG